MEAYGNTMKTKKFIWIGPIRIWTDYQLIDVVCWRANAVTDVDFYLKLRCFEL